MISETKPVELGQPYDVDLLLTAKDPATGNNVPADGLSLTARFCAENDAKSDTEIHASLIINLQAGAVVDTIYRRYYGSFDAAALKAHLYAFAHEHVYRVVLGSGGIPRDAVSVMVRQGAEGFARV